MKASSLSRFARAFRSTTGATRSSVISGTSLPSVVSSTASPVAPIRVSCASFSTPAPQPLSAAPKVPASSAKVAPYDDFAFSPVSHYPGPPHPPAHHEWSDRAKQLFASFENEGFSALPFIFHPHSFVAGGHGRERRLRYHFYIKKGTVPTPAEIAAGAAPAPAGAASSSVPTSAGAGVSAAVGAGGRPPLPTPADFTAEGNLLALAGVVHFGPDAQGPKGCVHGGALAAVADSVMALAVAKTGMSCVTANLNVNYKNLIPLDSAAVLRVVVPALDGRKVSVRFAFFSPAPPGEEPVLYTEGTALFIMPKGWENKTPEVNPM